MPTTPTGDTAIMFPDPGGAAERSATRGGLARVSGQNDDAPQNRGSAPPPLQPGEFNGGEGARRRHIAVTPRWLPPKASGNDSDASTTIAATTYSSATPRPDLAGNSPTRDAAGISTTVGTVDGTSSELNQRAIAGAGALASATALQAGATPVLFNFDNAVQYSPLPINLTVSGITAHLSATGQGFSIQAAGVWGFTPAGFSGLIISPDSVFAADLLVGFSQSLDQFSILYSPEEYATDSSATMRVTAYMNGAFVGTNTATAIPGTWPTATLIITTHSDFNSVVVHCDLPPPTGGDYGPVFMADNMSVTPVFIAVPSGLSFAVAADKGTAGDTMTVAGSGQAGDTVTLFDGAATIGGAMVAAAGMWSITTANPLAIGAHSLSVSQADPGGARCLRRRGPRSGIAGCVGGWRRVVRSPLV